mmetsp:Transcript_35440/g.80520  ORF Transcript_35440/g.80520 Transcript_35440/m.80520 type:complete len:263 (-) Transcript_35440:59-847(-)
MLVALHDVLGGEHADGEGVHEDVGDHVLAVPRLGLDEVRVVAVGLHERVLRGEARALEELLHGLLGAVEALGHEPVAVVLVAVLAPSGPVDATPVAAVLLLSANDLLGEGGEAGLARRRDLASLLQALRESVVLEALRCRHAVRRARVILVVHKAGTVHHGLPEDGPVGSRARGSRVARAGVHDGEQSLAVLLEDVLDEVLGRVHTALRQRKILRIRDNVRDVHLRALLEERLRVALGVGCRRGRQDASQDGEASHASAADG